MGSATDSGWSWASTHPSKPISVRLRLISLVRLNPAVSASCRTTGAGPAVGGAVVGGVVVVGAVVVGGTVPGTVLVGGVPVGGTVDGGATSTGAMGSSSIGAGRASTGRGVVPVPGRGAGSGIESTTARAASPLSIGSNLASLTGPIRRGSSNTGATTRSTPVGIDSSTGLDAAAQPSPSPRRFRRRLFTTPTPATPPPIAAANPIRVSTRLRSGRSGLVAFSGRSAYSNDMPAGISSAAGRCRGETGASTTLRTTILSRPRTPRFPYRAPGDAEVTPGFDRSTALL